MLCFVGIVLPVPVELCLYHVTDPSLRVCVCVCVCVSCVLLYRHSSTGTGRKKPCPNCGYSMLRKSKKCGNCGKPFGVFTFGRRQCTYCGHINLARMSSCFKCGQSLEKAPTAVPKITESKEKKNLFFFQLIHFFYSSHICCMSFFLAKTLF